MDVAGCLREAAIVALGTYGRGIGTGRFGSAGAVIAYHARLDFPHSWSDDSLPGIPLGEEHVGMVEKILA